LPAMVWRMQTNDVPAVPDVDDVDAIASGVPVPGRSRRRLAPGRGERLSPRFTPAERAEIEVAADSAGMSTSRFCAEAALAAARGRPTSLAAAQEREELARLQRQLFAARTAVVRFDTNVNQAVAALNTNGEAPDWMGRAVAMASRSVQGLDEVIAEVDRRLR
jgi:uncharacterized protein (DUF1778 family)